MNKLFNVFEEITSIDYDASKVIHATAHLILNNHDMNKEEETMYHNGYLAVIVNYIEGFWYSDFFISDDCFMRKMVPDDGYKYLVEEILRHLFGIDMEVAQYIVNEVYNNNY